MMPMTELESFEISVVVYPEVDRERGTIAWIAQCLEYDIASQGKSIAQAQERLERNVAATLAVCLEDGKGPLADIPKAPQKFWDLFKHAPQLIEEEQSKKATARRSPRSRIRRGRVKLADSLAA
jgi:hypothetical protein